MLVLCCSATFVFTITFLSELFTALAHVRTLWPNFARAFVISPAVVMAVQTGVVVLKSLNLSVMGRLFSSFVSADKTAYDLIRKRTLRVDSVFAIQDDSGVRNYWRIELISMQRGIVVVSSFNHPDYIRLFSTKLICSVFLIAIDDTRNLVFSESRVPEVVREYKC